MIFLLIGIIALASISCIERVDSESTEPEISIAPLAKLGPDDPDRWHVNISYPDDSPSEDFYIEGVGSYPSLSSTEAKVLVASIYEAESGKQVVQQDILLGFSYSWNYELRIVGRTLDVFEFNLDLGLPVQIELQYQEPMIEGISYPVFATLTPLDWPDFDEFICNFKVVGHTIFDVSQSFVTPIGPENAWGPFEIGPLWFWTGIPFVLFTLDVGFAIVPEVFSDRVEALAKAYGDASLQSSAITLNNEAVELLVWSSPGQTLEFNVLAEDISPSNYASLLLSQFRYFLNRLMVGFNGVLRANWVWGGSSRKDFRLFTLDASRLLPSLSFGMHPLSPTSEVRVDVLVATQPPVGVPEAPFDLILLTSVVFAAYLRLAKRRSACSTH